jgi:hypothetical protein
LARENGFVGLAPRFMPGGPSSSMLAKSFAPVQVGVSKLLPSTKKVKHCLCWIANISVV